MDKAPEICDIVKYRGDLYRVVAYTKATPAPPNHNGVRFTDADGNFHTWCSRDEATHAEIVGVCGFIAKISKLEPAGKVDWTIEQIEEERKFAKSLEGARII